MQRLLQSIQDFVIPSPMTNVQYIPYTHIAYIRITKATFCFLILLQTKRQLYREHLLPQKGGKIPDSAFHVDRLAANRLNKEGISIPDGVLLEQRHHESHFGAHRFDPDIERNIIRIKQTPDGRYTPVEGHYPVFENEIYSTYIIRPPAVDAYNKYNLVLPPFAPNFATQSLEIPNKLTHNKELSPKNVQNYHRNRLNHNLLLYNKPAATQTSAAYYYPKPEPPKNSLVRTQCCGICASKTKTED